MHQGISSLKNKMAALHENLWNGTQNIFLLKPHVIFTLNVDIFNVSGKTVPALYIAYDLSRYLDKYPSSSPHGPVREQKKVGK